MTMATTTLGAGSTPRMMPGDSHDPQGPADCEFCRIVRGETEATVVCETDLALAFFPLRPAVRGHTLVVPKNHVTDFWSAGEDTAVAVMQAVHRVGRAIGEALNPDGMNLISSAGEAATQTVYHLHVHVVPRWHGDPIGNIWPRSEPMSEQLEDEIADRIRSACRDQT
jgi:histidine triad (HIT) family protein